MLTDIINDALSRMRCISESFDPSEHPRGQPENAGQFATYFHGTKKENADAILAGGFKRNDKGSSLGGGIYLSKTSGLAEGYAANGGSLLKVAATPGRLLAHDDVAGAYEKTAAKLPGGKKRFKELLAKTQKQHPDNGIKAKGAALEALAIENGYDGFDVNAPHPYVVIFDPSKLKASQAT